jgi:hypothetical protein
MIKDSTTNKRSLTATVFFIGSMIALIKLLLSGITILEYTFPILTGSDFALIIGSLGGIYSLRRSKAVHQDEEAHDK